jgi:hypothetical protein
VRNWNEFKGVFFQCDTAVGGGTIEYGKESRVMFRPEFLSICTYLISD